MNRQCRNFLVALVVLTIAFGAILVDGTRAVPPAAAGRIVALTGLPDAALSVDYREPRWPSYADFRSTIHPELPPLAEQDFVHGR